MENLIVLAAIEGLIVLAGIILVLFLTVAVLVSRYKRCPSDRILVVYGKVGGGKSAICHHGGAAFIWPVIQDHQFLDLTPLPIDIRLEGALSKQNIRVNTPSTFTVGISTEPGVMENAAERLLGLTMAEINDLAKDIIFGQMRVVIATMNIEEINADRDKLIANIAEGVEVELKKVGLRLINVNIQDVTDVSGYIDALGQEAASQAINEAKIKVAQADRDGRSGSAEAERDQRIRVAEANAKATEGENLSGISIANSNAARRVAEADSERQAVAAEKVASARALQEAYASEMDAETKRAERDKATQYANEVIPAEIAKQRQVVDADAQAEKVRRIQQGEADARRAIAQAEADGVKMMKVAEADGLRARLMAEAEGTEEVLKKKAEGFMRLIEACGGSVGAQNMLITEQLPNLVREQVKAIADIKIDKVTVWDSGQGANGKNSTASFTSGLAGALPPLHELAKNAGLELPEYLGKFTEGPAQVPKRATTKPQETTEPDGSAHPEETRSLDGVKD